MIDIELIETKRGETDQQLHYVDILLPRGCNDIHFCCIINLLSGSFSLHRN